MDKQQETGQHLNNRIDTFHEAWHSFVTVAFLDPICAPILKRVNRVLLGAVERISAYNRKRGR